MNDDREESFLHTWMLWSTLCHLYHFLSFPTLLTESFICKSYTIFTHL